MAFHSISSPPPFWKMSRDYAPVTCRRQQSDIYDSSSATNIDSSIDPRFSRFGGERAVFLDSSFLFPRESRSPVINDCSSYGGQTRVYIHIYIYQDRNQVWFTWTEQGRGHRGAWGPDIPAGWERISESRRRCVSTIDSAERGAACARARYDAFERPPPSPLLTRAPLYPNTAFERLWSGGIRADSRVTIIGRTERREIRQPTKVLLFFHGELNSPNLRSRIVSPLLLERASPLSNGLTRIERSLRFRILIPFSFLQGRFDPFFLTLLNVIWKIFAKIAISFP